MTNTSTMPARRDLAKRVDEVILGAFHQAQPSELARLATEAADGDHQLALARIAKLAVEVRRENIAVLGDHHTFVRRTSDGAVRQLVRPVDLSIDAGDLYQINKRRKVWENGQSRWERNPAASLTFQGYLKLNAVAGLAIGNPPEVSVDGVKRANPYIERDDKGGIVRVVISVVVVGPAPATANPVQVQYLLDYDPRKDLLHMLAELAGTEKNKAEGVDLVTADDPVCQKTGHKFVEMYDGLGYVCDLTHPKVREMWAKWVNLLQNAVKKAQTVARRNAMSHHPGIGGQKSVITDEHGFARVAVVGWTGDAGTMRRYQEISERLSRGLPLAEDDDLRVIEDDYDPELHSQGDADEDLEDDERADLLARIDEYVAEMPAEDISEIDFNRDDASLDELAEVLTRLQTIAVQPDRGGDR